MSRPPRLARFELAWPDGTAETYLFTVPATVAPCFELFEGEGLTVGDKLQWILDGSPTASSLRDRLLDDDDPFDVDTLDAVFQHLVSVTTGRTYAMSFRLTSIALNSWSVLDVFATERGLPEIDQWTWSRVLNVTERLYLGDSEDVDRMRKEAELAKPLPGQSLEDAAVGTPFSAAAQMEAFRAAQASH